MISIRLGRWQMTILLYAIVVGLLVYLKPALMFDAEGNPKQFATENTPTTTPFAPIIMFPLLAFILYFIVATVDLSWT